MSLIMNLYHLNSLIIRVHGTNPFTEALGGRGGHTDLLRHKVWVSDVFVANDAHVVGQDVVFVVLVKALEESHIPKQLLRWTPKVFYLFAGARGIWNAVRFNAFQYADGFHHQLDTSWRSLHGFNHSNILQGINLMLILVKQCIKNCFCVV